MSGLVSEAHEFAASKWLEGKYAQAGAAYFLSCGVDLGDALKLKGQERALALIRLERTIERERLKGARRHWSYDLNRHIALKQALDMLRAVPDPAGTAPKCKAAPEGAA